MLSGSKAPERTWVAKYYAAEKYLGLTGNVFLLAICANGLVKLGMHFGFIDPALLDSLDLLVGIPFMALLVLYLGLWVRAFLRFAGMRMGRRVRNEASRRRRNLLFISLSGQNSAALPRPGHRD